MLSDSFREGNLVKPPEPGYRFVQRVARSAFDLPQLDADLLEDALVALPTDNAEEDLPPLLSHIISALLMAFVSKSLITSERVKKKERDWTAEVLFSLLRTPHIASLAE